MTPTARTQAPNGTAGATESERVQTEEVAPEIPACTGTLGERICAVMAELSAVTATGKNFQNKDAISIDDVAAALRPLKAKHGVLVRFRCVTATDLGGGKNWRVDLIAHVENASNPEQCFEDEWTETGSNLSAAYSFGRKSYEKMLFEIAAKEDDAPSQRAAIGTRPPVRQTPQRPPSAADVANDARDSGRAAVFGSKPPTEAAWVLGGICPECNARIGGSRDALRCQKGHTPDDAGELPLDDGDVDPDSIPFA